ncbi:MinD/ParA family ATP-binding protein [Caldimonas brevitalea]|uniref:Flagellar synthesis regulator FleN n=1 Tax=Caldimonas brevitalea TaxID=413882 RepID=A0A0G3BNK5_9BURK|nr:hypothetical protein [Caldimonas brevitalea]AKJ30982.1 flagellar synthesis regulator FleN [Caldimonas brevitalea]
MLERGFDQAHGLRRLFAHHTVHLLPVVANPYATSSHVLLEGLCQGLAAQGLHTLVVDGVASRYTTGVDVAAAIARDLDLGQWIDEFDTHTSVLAAGGSLARFTEVSEGRSALLFEALREAAPSADVIVFHADAAVLSALFGHRRVRPLVFTGDDAQSLKHAYASIKILAQYGGLLDHAVVMDATEQAIGVPPAALRLVRCVSDFLGGEAHLVALTSTANDNEHVLAQALHQLSMNLLHYALPFSLQDGENGTWGAMPSSDARAHQQQHHHHRGASAAATSVTHAFN